MNTPTIYDDLLAENERLRAELTDMRAKHPESGCYDALPTLRAQNAELLSALAKALRSGIVAHENGHATDGGCFCDEARKALGEIAHEAEHDDSPDAASLRSISKKARAAIAKAEGGK